MSALLDRLQAVPQTNVAKSIASHLHRFFNTRQHALFHLPAYGLPDINDVYARLPYSLESFTQTLRSQIMRYEPRLKDVAVCYQSLQGVEAVVAFEIIATLHNDEKVIFDAQFMPGGEVRVKQ